MSADSPTAPERHGYADGKEDLIKRLRRIEGQVGGIERMVESDRYCIDIVTQIGAAQAALDQVALKLLADHTRHCVMAADETKRKERTEELIDVFGRLLGARR